MKIYKPKFWDKKGFPNFISILLMPLSLIVIVKNYYENNTNNFYCKLVIKPKLEILKKNYKNFTYLK